MKNMLRDESTRTLTIPRSSVFSDAASGLRVLSKKYFVDIEVIHRHDFFELVLVRSGGGVHVTESGESPLGRGDVYLIRPGNVHYYRDLQSLEIINILYLPERLALPLSDLREVPGYVAFFEASQELAGALLLSRLRLSEGEMAEAERIIETMMDEQEKRRPGHMFGMTAGFMRLVLLISRAAMRIGGDDAAALGQVGRLLAYLEGHCSEPLQVADLARVNGISVRTLERLFRDATGRPPGEYLAELRLNRGAKILQESGLPVTQVARQVGFSDGGYFARLFRRKFGCSPREYRKRSTAGQGGTPRKGGAGWN